VVLYKKVLKQGEVMAIEAISGVRNNGLNSVNFEARKGKKSSPVSNPTSTVKAVPLAVILAMSPMTTTNAENIMRGENQFNRIELVEIPQTQQSGTVVQSQTYKIDEARGVLVDYIDLDGNEDNVELINLYETNKDYKGGKRKIETVYNQNLYLDTDNGLSNGPLPMQYVQVSWERKNPDSGKIETKIDNYDNVGNMVQYLAAFAKSPYNNGAIKLNKTEQRQHVRPDCTLKEEAALNFYDVKYEPIHKGECISYYDVKTQNDEYKLRMYSTDGNDENYEYMTLQGKNSSEFKIFSVATTKLKMEEPSYNNSTKEDYTLYHINIGKLDNTTKKAQYSILDKDLYVAIAGLMKHESFNNAIRSEKHFFGGYMENGKFISDNGFSLDL